MRRHRATHKIVEAIARASYQKPKATEPSMEEALSAARYWGAEYQANPGSSRSEYMESIAMKLGKERWFDLPAEQRNPLTQAFNEGVRAEQKAQGK